MKDKAVLELIIVLVLVFIGLWYLKKDQNVVVDEKTTTTKEIISTEDTSIGSVHANSRTTMTYVNALATYRNARIELDQNCKATPNVATYRNGDEIMIDNRSTLARTVKVGYVFPVKAWGFKIASVSSTVAPTTWYVDCGNLKNVATIYIQR